ncbi:putative retrotransposon gag domain-containing protein [Helianthus annuus]|nr:putative retrotransposon gag domain-containing protein [Helianthus annuus]
MPHTRSQGPVKPPIDKSSFSTPSVQVKKSSTSSSAPSDSTLHSKPPKYDFTPKSSPHNSPPPSRHPSPPPVHQMAENQTVHQRSTAGFTANSPITLSEITNDKSWQIPSYIMTAINNSCQFHGRDDEDAPAHINRLTRLCSTFGIEGVNLDARFLQVFPFSLAGRAATWLDSQPAGTYTTWAGLRDAFLAKYFPPAKASRLRDQIHSFRMEPDEPYHLAWERFQTLLSRCSQHGLSDWALVEKFYNGLTPECKARFDTSAGGHLMGKKTVADCNDLFESFAHADIDHSATGRNSNPVITSSSSRGVNQVVSDSKVISQLDYITKELLEIKKKVDRCEVCRGGHDTIDCPTLTLEQVEYIAGQNRGPTNPFNNSNSNWRANNYRSSGNPPGFPSGQYQGRGPGFYSSGGSGQTGPFASSGSGGQFRGEGSNQEVQPKSEGSGGSLSRIEDLLSQLLVKDQATQRTLEDHATLLKNNHSSFLDFKGKLGILHASCKNDLPVNSRATQSPTHLAR